MSVTFDDAFEDRLKGIRAWAEVGNSMPAKNANEKLAWLFRQCGITPDTAAGLEQQKTAYRRLEETLRPSDRARRQR